MFTPTTFGTALLMMIVSATCWGSWANTYKGVKNYRFELFYWDYAVGIFLAALVYALTMGSTTNGPTSFLNNVRSADLSNIGWALLAGIIFNLANLLLVAAIDMAGLAIAFPVAIGIALVVGTVLSFVQQQRGNVMMLGAGVLCAVVAVILDGKAYGELGTNREASRKSIIVCVISGVLMGLWAPFSTRALTHGNTLGPYSIAVFLTGGALLSCLWWNLYFMKKPLVGEPVAFSGFFRGPVNGHVLGRPLGHLRLERIRRRQ
jgi:glucose uptake protein